MTKEFTGLWIPRAILLDASVPAVQKLILAEIAVLQGEDGCFASNAHFARITGIKERMVRSHISRMRKAGQLKIENPTSPRRRMWVALHVLSGTQEESAKTDLSAPTETAAANDHREARSLRNSRGNVGNIRPHPEADCRDSRHSAATEITTRTQQEETMKLGAVTGRDGRYLASKETWAKWLRYAEKTYASGISEDAQLEYLAEMVEEGYIGDRLISLTMAHGKQAFWDSPSIVAHGGR